MKQTVEGVETGNGVTEDDDKELEEEEEDEDEEEEVDEEVVEGVEEVVGRLVVMDDASVVGGNGSKVGTVLSIDRESGEW